MGGKMAEPERQSLRQALNSGERWQGEVAVQRRDGRQYDAILSVTPIRDADGQITGYVTSHEDVSRFRELDRARTQFITNVSHQLRTPVTNMKLYAQLLQSGTRPEKADRYLDVLVEQADRLGDLILDILELTTLDSGQAITLWRPLVIPSLIADAVGRVRDRAEQVGLSLAVSDLTDDLPPVGGDQIRLGQALGELIENAVTFTPAGGEIELQVGTVSDADRTWVTIAVHDTGPGIPVEELPRLFDRFFRGRLAESRQTPGTGLGLSKAQEIVRAHGGRLTAHSPTLLPKSQGPGATFTVWLPGDSGPSQPAATGEASGRTPD